LRLAGRLAGERIIPLERETNTFETQRNGGSGG